jgi:hypothetical protein
MLPKSPAFHRPSQDARMRRGELFLFLPWALGTLLFSVHVVGARLFLVYLYGWSRVQNEHIRILSMPKGHPWPLSNGQQIREGHFIHYLISMVCCLVMFYPSYLLLRRLLPRARQADA